MVAAGNGLWLSTTDLNSLVCIVLDKTGMTHTKEKNIAKYNAKTQMTFPLKFSDILVASYSKKPWPAEGFQIIRYLIVKTYQ